MFYLWTLFAALLLFSVYGQSYIIFQGYIPNISSLAITIALLIAVCGMAYRKYQETHKRSRTVLNLGFCLMIIGFFIMINRSNFSNLEAFIRGVELASLLAIPGYLLMKYNQQSEIDDYSEKDESEAVRYDLFEVVYLFEQISAFKRIKTGFSRIIENCVGYLIAIEQNEYLINQGLIKLFINLLENYIELNELSVQTSRTELVLEKIESLFPKIETALEKAYNNSIHDKITEAEINLKVLETYLKSQNSIEFDHLESVQ